MGFLPVTLMGVYRCTATGIKPSIYHDLNAKVKVGIHSTVLFAVVVVVTHIVRFSNLCMFFFTYIYYAL